MMTPCNYRNVGSYREKLDVGEECIYDFEQQLKYLGKDIKMMLVFNERIFDPSKFDETKVIR